MKLKDFQMTGSHIMEVACTSKVETWVLEKQLLRSASRVVRVPTVGRSGDDI